MKGQEVLRGGVLGGGTAGGSFPVWLSLLLTLGLLAAFMLPPPAAQAVATVPPQFEDRLVTTAFQPTALAFTPDDRLLVTSKTGVLRIYKNGALLATPALDLSRKNCQERDRGLGGVAVDPAFASNHVIYLYYTFKKFGVCGFDPVTGPVNRLSRFTLGDDDVVDPASEVVMLDNIPSTDGIHNGGDIQFGKDGYLYVGVGDGGCDYAGDSGCGPNNDAARDQNILLGKILRVTPEGEIPPTNPFLGTGSARCNITGQTDPGKRCQETYAWGLRNPFRIAFDPDASATRFFINDVGQDTWEEIDLGTAGADYGWNVREGHCATGSSTSCGSPPAGMTNPIYDYNHSSGCSAVTGAAFVPNGSWPTSYDDAYLYGDYVCGKIFELLPTQSGGFSASEFATGAGGIASMIFGPYAGSQALYYTDVGAGEVRRIAYVGTANRAPNAKALASPAYGNLPLAVSFDGSDSSDVDNDPLSYDWDFGDGSAHATTATPTHTYTVAGTYTASLRVSDNHGASDTATVRIDAGNNPPAPAISAPAATKLFRVGEQITLSGSATDPEEGTLADSALTWTVIKHHNTHTHPFLPPTSGNDVPITAQGPEDLASTTNSYLEITLTATDSKGLSTTISQQLRPHLVDVTLATDPSGLKLGVNASTITGPTTIVSWEAWALNVSASKQTDSSGRVWIFSGWSDGGAAAHTITTPASAATYSATFDPTCGGLTPTGGPTEGNDVIIGTAGNDTIDGGGGNDTICGAGGSDTLRGGAGNDKLYGEAGNDAVIDGGDGNDTLDGGVGAEALSGGPGSDTASYANRTSGVTVDIDGVSDDGNSTDGPVGARDNVMRNVENVTGGAGADSLAGSGTNNLLNGGKGADVLSGLAGVDTASYGNRTVGVTVDIDGVADDGNSDDGLAGARDNVMTDIENLTGGSGADTLIGGGAANKLTGGLGSDILRGLDGNDNLLANDGVPDVEVSCDGGASPGAADSAHVDAGDPATAGCESVGP